MPPLAVVRACRGCLQPFTLPAIPQLPGRYCSLKCAEAAALGDLPPEFPRGAGA
jgi:hypothetical protein